MDTEQPSRTGLAAPPLSVPRLISAIRDGADAGSLATYRSMHPRPAVAVPGRPNRRLIELVEESGLRGRGGAAFPTGRKLETVSSSRSVPIVVVNATEGEPLSGKDRLLARRGPHLLLDGAAWAAAAVGADRIQICVDRSHGQALASLRAAVAERDHLEPGGTPVEVLGTPPRYVAGEETALVHWLNGGEAKPTTTPPRPFESGVARRPTLINNAETVSQLALIAENGCESFRARGTVDEPGTMLVSISGAVPQARVVEIDVGAPLVSVVHEVGGMTTPLGAILIGGYFGSWVPAGALGTLRLSNECLRGHGASLGCGAVHLLPESACGVLETARVLGWFGAESAGQCGPCVHGLAAIANGMRTMTLSGRTDPSTLLRWADEIEHRGACAMPDGAARFLRSALHVFAEHIEEHRQGRACVAAQRVGVLPIPNRHGEGGWV
jgi:NADH:ubiquinone oxidoreductase subunit F (NADH-binding)